MDAQLQSIYASRDSEAQTSRVLFLNLSLHLVSAAFALLSTTYGHYIITNLVNLAMPQICVLYGLRCLHMFNQPPCVHGSHSLLPSPSEQNDYPMLVHARCLILDGINISTFNLSRQMWLPSSNLQRWGMRRFIGQRGTPQDIRNQGWLSPEVTICSRSRLRENFLQNI